MSDDPLTFGRRLKALRERAGLTQKELAERAGLALSAVGHLEQGLRQPSWATVVALGKALGVRSTAFEEETGAPEADALPRRPGRPRAAEKPAPKKGRRKK
jgi:transcriptional regulator with XRE-family HTH domain